MARLPGPAVVDAASFSTHYTFIANFTDSYCLSDYDFGAALAGSTNSQLFNRHADWGPCVSDARYLFNTSFVAISYWESSNKVMSQYSEIGNCAAFHARTGQPIDHHDRNRQLAHRPRQRPAGPGIVGLARHRRLRHAIDLRSVPE